MLIHSILSISVELIRKKTQPLNHGGFALSLFKMERCEYETISELEAKDHLLPAEDFV